MCKSFLGAAAEEANGHIGYGEKNGEKNGEKIGEKNGEKMGEKTSDGSDGQGSPSRRLIEHSEGVDGVARAVGVHRTRGTGGSGGLNVEGWDQSFGHPSAPLSIPSASSSENAVCIQVSMNALSIDESVTLMYVFMRMHAY